MAEFDIRWARQEEWPEIMDMVWNTFLRFDGQDCTMEGKKSFGDFIADPALFDSFLAGKYQMLIALDEGKVVGAASLRNINHLSLLFVHEDYQLMGIGSSLLAVLCDYLKHEVGMDYLTVDASPYAVDFYKKMGFNQLREPAMYSGVRVTSMEKIIP